MRFLEDPWKFVGCGYIMPGALKPCDDVQLQLYKTPAFGNVSLSLRKVFGNGLSVHGTDTGVRPSASRSCGRRYRQ